MHRVLSQIATTAPEKSPIGHVLMAFAAPDGAAYCVLQLDDSAYPQMSEMINKQMIKGVSLTHLAESLTPIEVSLCVNPARPGIHLPWQAYPKGYVCLHGAIPLGALIRLATSELKMAKLYTELLREGKIRTDKSMSEKNDQPTEMERVLALLSDTDRAIVEQRLIAMSKAAMEAKKSNVAAAPFASSADQQVRYSAHRDEEHMDAHRRFFFGRWQRC